MLTKLHASFWGPALAGFFTFFIGIGIARFAYTPILPALIQQHWMTHSQAGYLGATNFAGYLLGAFIARWPTRYCKHKTIIYINMIVCTLSLAACAWDGGQIWLNTWRFISGLTGAFIMVLTPAIIYAATPAKRNGLVGGIMFTGIGFGGIFCGLVLPNLLLHGIALTWLSIAGVSLLAVILACLLLPKEFKLPKEQDTHASKKSLFSWPLLLLIIAYTLYGIGAVPHTLFIVEYIANYLHEGNHLGGIAWSLYGTGMIVGTLVIGYLSDHFSKGLCLLGSYLMAFISVLLLLLSTHLSVIYLSTFIMGSLYLTLVVLSTSRLSELLPASEYTRWWGYVTGTYAIAQAVAGYGMAYLLKFRDGYQQMFSIGAAAFFIAFCMVCACMIIRRRLKI